MEIKAWVLDRVEQSFIIFKNNFINFFTPIFIYNLISFFFFWVIFTYYAFRSVSNIDTTKNIDIFIFLYDPKIIILIILGLIIFILYLTIYIVVLLGLIKSIKQALEWEKINIKDNLSYWLINLTNSFKTYWYIFSYIALKPAIVFIVGWILFNLWYFYKDIYILKEIWLIIIILWIIWFIISSIYRWVKVNFSINSAVDKNDFSKENFINSIYITNNNWWRIVWNYFVIWLIISLASWVFSWLLWFSFFNSIDYSSIKTIDDIKQIFWNFSILKESISGFVNTIINTITSVFLIIFAYIFYLRLKAEFTLLPNNIPEITNNITKEL